MQVSVNRAASPAPAVRPVLVRRGAAAAEPIGTWGHYHDEYELSWHTVLLDRSTGSVYPTRSWFAIGYIQFSRMRYRRRGDAGNAGAAGATIDYLEVY